MEQGIEKANKAEAVLQVKIWQAVEVTFLCLLAAILKFPYQTLQARTALLSILASFQGSEEPVGRGA